MSRRHKSHIAGSNPSEIAIAQLQAALNAAIAERDAAIVELEEVKATIEAFRRLATAAVESIRGGERTKKPAAANRAG
jgi:hypothetical protein